MIKLRFESHWGVLSKREQEELKASGTVLCRTMAFTWYKIQDYYIKEQRVGVRGESVTKGDWHLLKDVLPLIEKGEVMTLNKEYFINSGHLNLEKTKTI